MATPERLMGVGMDAEKAKRCGFFIHEVGSQESRTIQGPGNVMVIVSNASASVILGSNFDIGDRALIVARAVAVSLYGGTAEAGGIYPTSAAVARPVTADSSREFFKAANGVWYTIGSA